MPVHRASLMLPCSTLDDLPTQLEGSAAAEFLAAWTTLWHPALIDATGSLPGCHSSIEPPEPDTLQDELVVVPPVSRERLPAEWCDRLRAAGPRNPPPLESRASREQTIAAMLTAASLAPSRVSAAIASDFLALGYAHLQVELLTRAMRYTTLLDADEFRTATIDAANAAVAGNEELARDGLGRAFDLLTDARNHFYAVDFYLVDITLLAGSTLGEPLRAKLVAGPPTSLLASADLLGQLGREQPETLADLRRAIKAGRACVLGGPLRGSFPYHCAAEAILADLVASGRTYRQSLARDPAVFGQFGAAFSPLLPEVLTGLSFRAALYAAFDGGRLPRPPQPKTRWGPRGGPTLEILTAVPLDIAEPATWLTLGERIGDSLVRDHVATVLLAGWPGQGCEYYEDLRRIAQYSPVLGKFVTLDDYFCTTLETDDWSSFYPQEYPSGTSAGAGKNYLSSRVDAYRRQVAEAFDRLSAGLAAIVPAVQPADAADGDQQASVLLNPWNFACPRYIGFDALEFGSRPANSLTSNPKSKIRNPKSEFCVLPNVPGCGYATFDAALADPPVPLAAGRTLRNEWLELAVGESTGGIQSLRTHGDRSTRVSQRLVMHDRRLPRDPDAENDSDDAPPSTRMLADRIEITRSDAVAGEITSHGRLVDAEDRVLARFVQTTRLVRGTPAAIVDVQLEPEVEPEGDIWNCYLASRLAWRDEALTVRHGVDWVGRETTCRRIESPDWVELSDAAGRVTCFGLGLPLHALAGPTWLDTLLSVAGETQRQFQFAIGLDCRYPTQTALALLTGGRPSITKLHSAAQSPRSWFLHVSAGNVVVTHLEPLPAPAAGVRMRVLETEGRSASAALSAFRQFCAARRTDFRGESAESLAVVDGRVQLDIGPDRWLQIEAEW